MQSIDGKNRSIAKIDRWQELIDSINRSIASIDSIDRSLKLVNGVNRSKILIRTAVNKRHIDRIVGPNFFRFFFAPYKTTRHIFTALINYLVGLIKLTIAIRTSKSSIWNTHSTTDLKRELFIPVTRSDQIWPSVGLRTRLRVRHPRGHGFMW